jgi:hypothetical protein
VLLCSWSAQWQSGGIGVALAQSAGTADDSITTTTTTDDAASGLALCQELWIQSDADQDGKISRSEYINWVVKYSPYSPNNCPNQAYISQFLGDAPLAVAFDSLACLCQSYGAYNNASCCDLPHLELPNASYFPSSYPTTVCQTIDRVLEDQCRNATSSSVGNTTTASDGANTTTSSSSSNGTSASNEEDPSAVNFTNPIVFGDGSDGEGGVGGSSATTATATPTAPAAEGDSQQGRMMVQLVLPLLLVAAAAVFMGVTLVLYQRRKYAIGASSASPDSSGAGGSWNYRFGRKKAAHYGDRGDPTDAADASSTDSDEEAVAGDEAGLGGSNRSGRTVTVARASRPRRGDRSSSLIDIDTGAPVARRMSSDPASASAKAARRSSRRRHKAQTSSLLDSVARLEPLREVEEGELDYDEDGTAAQSELAVVGDSLSSPSLLVNKVSFCDDDNEDDEVGDEDVYDEERPQDGAAVQPSEQSPTISALLQDLWGQRGSHDPPTSRDDEGAGFVVRDRIDADVESNQEAASDRDAPGTTMTAASGFQSSDVVQPEGSKVVVVQIPDAIIRRTKDNDESFDEVSL